MYPPTSIDTTTLQLNGIRNHKQNTITTRSNQFNSVYLPIALQLRHFRMLHQLDPSIDPYSSTSSKGIHLTLSTSTTAHSTAHSSKFYSPFFKILHLTLPPLHFPHPLPAIHGFPVIPPKPPEPPQPWIEPPDVPPNSTRFPPILRDLIAKSDILDGTPDRGCL